MKQTDIFGNKHDINPATTKTNQSIKTKYFPKINLEFGLETAQMQTDYILVHRIMQKKLANNNISKNMKSFIKIFCNELKIKAGKQDIVSATRDSLIEYCLK